MRTREQRRDQPRNEAKRLLSGDENQPKLEINERIIKYRNALFALLAISLECEICDSIDIIVNTLMEDDDWTAKYFSDEVTRGINYYREIMED